MKDRGLTQHELSRLSGVDQERIRKLCNHTWGAITQSVAGKLCTALGVGMGELFEIVPADIWWSVRRDRKLTVHLGSTSLEARSASLPGATLDRLGIGTWDVRALFHVYEYLNRTTMGGVVFEYAEHSEDLSDPACVDGLFGEGSHLILGSPLVNPIAEDAVCRASNVPPRDRRQAGKFAFRFRWDRPKESSFGEFGGSCEPGIVARGDTGTIARRTVIASGDDGEDCGLVFAFRHAPQVTSGGRPTQADESIVIVIMGHSGCGTLGGTQLVCSDEGARAVYPERRGVGALHAYTVGYRRDETSSSGFDNRTPISWALVGRTPARMPVSGARP
jgi:DNA-binding Xre family transcriptional regulator